MGYQSFDEQLMMSVSDAELDEITVGYVVKSAIVNKNMALVIQADEGVQNTTNIFAVTWILVIALSIGFATAFLNKKKSSSSSKSEAITEMKEGLVVDSQQ